MFCIFCKRNEHAIEKRVDYLTIDLWYKIAFIPREESWREKARLLAGIGKIPDESMAWSSLHWKRAIPDIEFFINEYCVRVAQDLKDKGLLYDKITGELNEQLLTDILMKMIGVILLHELIHTHGEVVDEEVVEKFVTEMVQEYKDIWMTWTFVPCPKKKMKKVTLIDCFACDDLQKHGSCPLQKIRKLIQPREYKPNEYHVTELFFPRYAYYERTRQRTASWNDMWDIIYGNALHHYIQTAYDADQKEIALEEDFGEFKIVGSADIVDIHLIDLKFYYTIKWICKENEAHDFTQFQVRCYWRMGRKTKNPKIRKQFEELRGIKVIYFSKMRGRTFPRYREFPVPVTDIDLFKHGRVIHEALKNHKPPEIKCPSWRCKFCAFIFPCKRNEP